MTNQTLDRAEADSSAIPSFTLDATNKFAAQVLRLYADLNLVHSQTDASEYLELQEKATEMEEWRSENTEKCES